MPRGRPLAIVEHLFAAIIDSRNRDPKPFVCAKSADQILASLARFLHRSFDSEH